MMDRARASGRRSGTRRRMVSRTVPQVMAAAVAWGLLLHGAAAAPPKRGEDTETRIARLIRQLGDDDFTRRELAEQQLADLGLAAFDALLQARWSDDIEIAMRSYRLVRRVDIRWVRPEDGAEVRRLLERYGKQPAAARIEVMRRLAMLDHDAGLPVLARLARFEPSETLSKEAALAFLRRPAAPADVAAATKGVNRTLGTSTRPAVEWIRRALTMWRHPEGRLDEWRGIVDDESHRFVLHPASSSRNVMRKLYREYARVLRQAGREADAQREAARYVDMIDDDRSQLIEAADWFVERGWSDLAERLHRRFEASFRQNPDLFFRLAEVRRRAGDETGAGQAAEQGLAALWPGGPQGILVTGIRLENDGYYTWAEFLYRKMVPSTKPPSLTHELLATRRLAELLHELERDAEAERTLRRLIQPDAEAELRKRIERMVQLSQEELAARADFFAACQAERTGDVAEQRDHLRKALARSPHDVEILIAAYHASAPDSAWRRDVVQRIDETVRELRASIASDQADLAKRLTSSQRRPIESHLAQQWNLASWLISNTEGDLDWALQSARNALTHEPANGAFLDTLARCYFARGDLERAIKYQRQAVALMPHSLPIRRQLDFFLRQRLPQDAAD